MKEVDETPVSPIPSTSIEMMTDRCENDEETSSPQIPLTTTEGIKAPPLTQMRPGGIEISKRALKKLETNRVLASIQYCNSDMILYNDQPQIKSFKEDHQRKFNLEDLYYSSPDIYYMVESTPYDQLPDIKSLQFLSFKIHPEMWIKRGTDKPIGERRPIEAIEAEVLPAKKGANTSTVDQDTPSPDIRRGVGEEKNVCVVFGDPNIIATALDSSLSYSKACDRTYRSFFGLKHDKSNPKRSNDFPVLVTLDMKSKVSVEGEEYLVDFGEKTKHLKCRTTPLLLTSVTEAVQRVQVSFLEELYQTGDVKLDESPIDPKKIMYRLDDTDRVSQIMNFHRSDSILYHVRIRCSKCHTPHPQVWIPNNQTCVATILSTTACDVCGTCTLVNHSSFVLREVNNREALDPAASRKINYEFPRDGKQFLYPTGVNSADDLQPYELVSEMASPFRLPIEMYQDASRKNQRTKAIAITLHVPTCFDKQKTIEEIKDQLLPTGLTVQEEDIPNSNHCIDMFVYHEGREHAMTMVATRVKVSITCNKVIDTTMLPEVSDVFKKRMGNLGDCVQIHQSHDQVQVHVPSNQTCKRIGVQTVSEEGEILIHSASVLVTPTNRKSGKRQENTTVVEKGGMMTATNFWCHPNFEKSDNFLRFGQSLLGALVSNVYNQGVLHFGETKIEMLPKGAFPWIELEKIYGTIPLVLREELVRKVSKKVEKELQSKDDKIKELGQELKVAKQKSTGNNDTETDALHQKIGDLERELEEVTQERDTLRDEKDQLERELRVVRRECARLQGQYDELAMKMQQTEKDMQGKIQSLETDKEEMKRRTDDLAMTVDKLNQMMNNQNYQMSSMCNAITDFDLDQFV